MLPTLGLPTSIGFIVVPLTTDTPNSQRRQILAATGNIQPLTNPILNGFDIFNELHHKVNQINVLFLFTIGSDHVKMIKLEYCLISDVCGPNFAY